ncbi:hypothetical protein [Arachidicoccus sp.]|uniref:hypothetical protein n=1 Tax=Arachidicoccus sp. TaxID=1872624 RepID=UPI003D1B5770
MKNEKKELIEHISERLKAHEEEYRPGAWESFVQYEKSKNSTITYLRRFAAAASILLLLGVGAYLYFNGSQNTLKINTNSKISIAPSNLQESKTQNQLATHKSNAQKQNGATNHSSSRAQVPSGYPSVNISKGYEENAAAYLNKNMAVDSTKPLHDLAQSNYRHIEDTSKVLAARAKQRRVLPKIWIPYNSQEDKQRKDLHLDQMAYDNQHVSDNVGAKKWSLGVVVTPGVSNTQKVNMGYGVTVGYQLTKKLSLNSGLAYTALSGSKDVSDNTVVVGSRTLQSVEADVAGVNLPIELRYNFSDNLYASAGVSAMAVLSNSQQNHYVVTQFQTSSFDAKNGSLLKTQSIVNSTSTKTVEQVPTSELNNQNFAGFLNFSFGYKQKISSKMKSISVEPFISVPMSNNLANQNIHLGEMGVRFKFGL